MNSCILFHINNMYQARANGLVFLNNALCCFSRFLSLFALMLSLSLSCSVTGFLFRLCFLKLELRTAGICFLYGTVPVKAQSLGLSIDSFLFAVIYPGDRIFGEPQSRFSDLFGLVGSFKCGVILLILRDLTMNTALDSAGYSCWLRPLLQPERNYRGVFPTLPLFQALTCFLSCRIFCQSCGPDERQPRRVAYFRLFQVSVQPFRLSVQPTPPYILHGVLRSSSRCF